MAVRVPRLGSLLEPSWGPIGPSWRPLGQSWGHLGPFGGPLGDLSGRLGAVLWASWGVLERRKLKMRERQNPSKTNGKSTIFASWGPFWRPLGCLLGHLGGLLGRLEAILGVVERSSGVWGPSWTMLGASWGPLGAIWSPLGLRNRIPASLARPCRDLPGVLFARGPPGAAPRARTRNIVYLLPEILARLGPLGRRIEVCKLWLKFKVRGQDRSGQSRYS